MSGWPLKTRKWGIVQAPHTDGELVNFHVVHSLALRPHQSHHWAFPAQQQKTAPPRIKRGASTPKVGRNCCCQPVARFVVGAATAGRWSAKAHSTLLAGGEWGSGPQQINQQHQQEKESAATVKSLSVSDVVFCAVADGGCPTFYGPSAAPVPSPAASRTDKVPFTILHTLAFVSLHQHGGVNIPQFPHLHQRKFTEESGRAAFACLFVLLVCCFFCSGVPLSLRNGRGGNVHAMAGPADVIAQRVIMVHSSRAGPPKK